MHRAQPFLLSLPTGAGKPPKYLQGSICFLSPTPTLSDGLAETQAVVYVWCAPQGLTCWEVGPQCGVGGLGPLRGQAYREVIGSLAVLGNWPCLVLRKGLLGKSRSFPSWSLASHSTLRSLPLVYHVAVFYEAMQPGPTPETLPRCLGFLPSRHQATWPLLPGPLETGP